MPDPRLRTWQRLGAWRNWIADYERRTGTLPAHFQDFAPPPSGGLDLFRDAWGNPIRYMRMGTADYEVRSAGADGIPRTSDDMVATRATLPPRPGS